MIWFYKNIDFKKNGKMDIIKRLNRITSNKILKNIITWLSTYGVII
jgi:hypothetical protein